MAGLAAGSARRSRSGRVGADHHPSVGDGGRGRDRPVISDRGLRGVSRLEVVRRGQALGDERGLEGHDRPPVGERRLHVVADREPARGHAVPSAGIRAWAPTTAATSRPDRGGLLERAAEAGGGSVARDAEARPAGSIARMGVAGAGRVVDRLSAGAGTVTAPSVSRGGWRRRCHRSRPQRRRGQSRARARADRGLRGTRGLRPRQTRRGRTPPRHGRTGRCPAAQGAGDR